MEQQNERIYLSKHLSNNMRCVLLFLGWLKSVDINFYDAFKNYARSRLYLTFYHFYLSYTMR